MSQINGTVRIRATGETVCYVNSRGEPMTEHERGPRSSAGFWVRDRRIMSLISTHVRAIVDYPGVFGLSAEQVHSAFERYDERIGREGRARIELIREASRAGWVRVRHYTGRARDYWSIQADTIEGRRETINLFLRFALEQGIAHEHQEAFIVGYDDGQLERYPFTSGGIGGYADVYLR